MQQSRHPVEASSRLSGFFGSRLMIAITAVAIVIVAVVVFRATRSNSTNAPRAAASANRAGHASHHTKSPAAKPTKALTTYQLQVRAMRTERKHYAARIVPVIDRSTRVFDAAARGAASANSDFNALEQSCSYWGGKVVAIEASYEGIPHPYVWWTPAGTLHHQVSGVFHYMLGAIQNCEESVQSTDAGASASALAEMATAARKLHSTENYARYLATH